jgi:hypothetical protein
LPHVPENGGEFVMTQLAYSLLEACEAARIGRTDYEAIRSGQLRAVERRSHTLILARRSLESLPAVSAKGMGGWT